MHELKPLYANIFLSHVKPLFAIQKDARCGKGFDAVQKTRKTCFIGSKSTRLHRLFLKMQ